MTRRPQHPGRSPQRAGGPVLCRPDRCPENSPARTSQTKDAGCGQGTKDYSYRSGPPVARPLKGHAGRQYSAQSMMRNTVAPNPSTASQDSAAPKQLTPKPLAPKPLAPKARECCLMPPKVHRTRTTFEQAASLAAKKAQPTYGLRPAIEQVSRLLVERVRPTKKIQRGRPAWPSRLQPALLQSALKCPPPSQAATASKERAP